MKKTQLKKICAQDGNCATFFWENVRKNIK
jgi:hypothetical protein